VIDGQLDVSSLGHRQPLLSIQSRTERGNRAKGQPRLSSSGSAQVDSNMDNEIGSRLVDGK
jgi:hypothetical protein